MKMKHDGNPSSVGFSLPTILVVSTVMLIVLTTAVGTVGSLRTSLNDQHYERLAKSAAHSGVEYAKSCLKKSANLVTWSVAKPLGSNTDCAGTVLVACSFESVDDRCWVQNSGAVRTTFSVPYPTGGDIRNVTAIGTLDLLRTATTISHRTVQQSARVSWGTQPETRLIEWSQLTAGGGHVCALAPDNTVYCWGSNMTGQIGDGTLINRNTPTAVVMSGALAGKTVTQLTAGDALTCALASDNTVYCWGNNSSGQIGDGTLINRNTPTAVVMSGALAGKTVTQIAAGSYHVCALASDNTVYCWGTNMDGQLGDGTSTFRTGPVAVVMSGDLAGKTVTQLTAGARHTCALASDNTAYCWGRNGTSQLGDGTTTTRTSPRAVAMSGALAGKTVTQLAAGQDHTCALASDNTAYCWGHNTFGRVGDGTTTTRSTPTAVDMSGALVGKTLTQISTKSRHTCALASNNTAYCWGENQYSKLGDGTTTNRNAPIAVTMSGALAGKSVTQLVTGYEYSCALASDNTAHCWGDNGYGQLGDGTTLARTSPVPVSSVVSTKPKSFTSAGTGLGHTCALASDNSAYCWGYNIFGQLGDGKSVDQTLPFPVINSGVLAGRAVLQLAVSSAHTCAVASDNTAYCWGGNGNGQLGNGTTTPRSTPAAVTMTGALAGRTVTQMVASGERTCALASDNTAYCWGYNQYGQVGDGTTTNRSTPTAVTMTGALAGKRITQLTAGFYHTCALASDNAAYCWGDNGSGRLGDGTSSSRSTPTAVTMTGALAGKRITQLTAGYYHTCALASDNTAYCWGNNQYGQVGDGTATNRTTPVAVQMTGALAGKRITQLTAGADHTCAIASDNTAYCWGRNQYGQLGGSTTVDSSTPTPVLMSGSLTGKTIIGLTTRVYHTCAIASDNTAHCWGQNSFGALGVGNKIDSSSPLQVDSFAQKMTIGSALHF